ncbi:MAG: 6-carboxytetrahydropterin synthase [Crocinitomicaceae bacterium]|nr:6-carboxytetrahydropterin synthase [Crocinitomicaceae bacterium]
MNLRVSKIFEFETAHALWGYDGKCANIHGHSYVLTVAISGPVINDPNHVKNGMIMDFGDLKKIVKKEIVDVYDHCLLVRANTPHAGYADVETAFKKIWLTDFQPTCENMLIDMVKRLQFNLPDHITLKYVKLLETRSSYAEWFEEDN